MNDSARQIGPSVAEIARQRGEMSGTSRINILLIAAFFAGELSPFTVNVVGLMPIGEIVLFGLFFFAVMSVVMTHRWPNSLFAGRLFWLFMGSQLIAFLGYIFSDLVRGSSTHDLSRGWARMIFLAIDIVAMAFLAGNSKRALVVLIIGGAVGNCADTLIHGALFDDYWKFGYGSPLTKLAVLGSVPFGLVATQVVAVIFGCVNLAMDFRSLGAQCILVASILAMLRLRLQVRLLLLPVIIVVSLGAGAIFYQWKQESGGTRATRSNIERTAMMTAAWEAFVKSPVVGNGSWFSNTDVMDHFLELRTEYAKREGLGGFTTSEVEEGLALHSQILVGLAEGGLAGGCFFFCYGLGLVWAIGYCAFFRPADGLSAIYLLTLAAALSNLFFSPFSGEHRVNIALAAGIVLQLWQEWRTRGLEEEESLEEEVAPSVPTPFEAAYERKATDHHSDAG